MSEMGEPLVAALQVRAYMLDEYESIEWRGNRWAVTSGFGQVLNKSGMWEWEPNPSSREEEFIERTRYETAEDAFKQWLAFSPSEAPEKEDADEPS